MKTWELYSGGFHFRYVTGDRNISVRKALTGIEVRFTLSSPFDCGMEFDRWCAGFLAAKDIGGWGGLL